MKKVNALKSKGDKKNGGAQKQKMESLPTSQSEMTNISDSKDFKTVTIQELEQKTGRVELKKLPPIQEANYRLILYILGAICFITVLILVDNFFRGNPANVIDLRSGVATGKITYQDAVQMYKDLQAVSLDRVTGTFTLLVSTALLPVLTSVIGYLFGSRQVGRIGQDGQEGSDS